MKRYSVTFTVKYWAADDDYQTTPEFIHATIEDVVGEGGYVTTGVIHHEVPPTQPDEDGQ